MYYNKEIDQTHDVGAWIEVKTHDSDNQRTYRFFEIRLNMVTRKGKEKGEKKRGMRVSIEEGKEKEKRSWENRKGREISEMGIDIKNWLQLWDDNPLVGCQESKIFITICFYTLGYGVKGKNIQTEKINICTRKMRNF